MSSKSGSYHILASGYRPDYSYLSFEPATAKIKVVKDSPAPKKAAWIEPGNTPGVYYSIKEDSDGEVVCLKLDEEGEVEITGTRKTNGGPAHGELIEKSSTHD
jgi:hypothetical protein